jgi:hypothetical protein
MNVVCNERQGPAAEVLMVGETAAPNGTGEVRVKLAAFRRLSVRRAEEPTRGKEMPWAES